MILDEPLGDKFLGILEGDYYALSGLIQGEAEFRELDEFAQLLIDSGQLNFGEEPNVDYIKGVAHGWVAAMRGHRDALSGA